jgi:hypothetical protein
MNTDATVNFFSGEEAEQYGELIGDQQQGMSLTNIPYKAANDGSISFSFDGSDYNGRFPIRVSFYATSDKLTSDIQIVTLVGANTVGEYFNQGNYSNIDYDIEKDKDGNPVKISVDGCALCCIAIALTGYGVNVDPVSLNKWMSSDEHYCFDPHHNGKVNFNFVPQYYTNSPIGTSSEQAGDNLNPLNYNLEQGNPTIAAVQSGDHLHWVLITGIDPNGSYTILDPGHKDETILQPSKIIRYREIITK